MTIRKICREGIESSLFCYSPETAKKIRNLVKISLILKTNVMVELRLYSVRGCSSCGSRRGIFWCDNN